MKNIIITFIHKPLLVVVVSLVFALAIFLFFQNHTDNAVTESQFVQVTSGTITRDEVQAQHLTLAFLTGGRIADVFINVGDTVTKDMVLASLDQENTQGPITQALAAFHIANANYQKVLNGATGPAIDVARTTLDSAKVNLEEVKQQQDVLVQNAYTALLNVSPQAYPGDVTGAGEDVAPKITGSYTLSKEGDIVVETYASAARSGLSYRISGLVEGTESALFITQQPLGNSGLHIQFPEDARANRTWIISLPNKRASDYAAKESAYQSALQTKSQVIATAQSAVNQAEANLAVVVSSARPEDVATAEAQVESARGALQIAQAGFNNRLILAPSDGIVTAVHINPGQIATQNIPAIEITGSTTKEVAVMVPNTAIITRDGKNYIEMKVADGTSEVEITLGAHDAQNTEVVSGLSVGDFIVIQ